MRRLLPATLAAAMSIAPAAMAQAPGFDGVDRPPAGGASGTSQCGTTKFGYPVRVASGVASVQTVSRGELQGPVAPDGSLMIQAGTASFAGKFAGKHFSGTFTVQRCVFSLEYDKN